MSSSPRLERIKDLLDQVDDLALDERAAYLDAHCDDLDLRAEVESLLAFDDAAPAWPEAPLLTAPTEAPGPWVEQLSPGTMVGPYRVVQPLGVGGMGAVAAAVREGDFAKTVAVKVLHERPSRQSVRRFHDERQILAGLEHRNIARILDGGTTDDGRPYFAMELVDGLPIDVYSERRQLDVDATVRLVLKVCSALAASHQRLVVHRDIKPSNLLVDAAGEPKLLDFGIAKRLGPGVDDLTRRGHRPMTLRYASPEQVAGTPVTTATDVWGVGVLLYQLLTGTHPFGSLDSGALDVAEAIRDETPPRPSAAAVDPVRGRRLRGDLDAILLHALRKEPEHRYPSIEALAADLEAYLERRPVAARRGGRAYVVRRFVRRYRWPITAVAAIVVLSITFGVVSWALLQRAEEQRELARLEESKTNRGFELVQNILLELKPRAGESTPEQVFAAALREVESRVMASEDAEIKLELLAAFSTVYTAWGEIDDACRVSTTARQFAEESFEPTSSEVFTALTNEASCRFNQEDFATASRLWDQALALQELGQNIGRLPRALANSGTGHRSLGHDEKALELYRRSLDMSLELAARFSGWEPQVAKAWRSLSVVHLDRGEILEAEEAARAALEWLARAPNQGSGQIQIARATMQLGLARILDEQPHRRAETESLYREALGERLELFGKDHDHVALARLDLARFLLEEPDLDEAWILLDQVLAVLDDPRDRARAQSVEALYRARTGRLDEAEALLVASLEVMMEGREVPDIHARRTTEWLEQVRAARNDAAPGVGASSESDIRCEVGDQPAESRDAVGDSRDDEALHDDGAPHDDRTAYQDGATAVAVTPGRASIDGRAYGASSTETFNPSVSSAPSTRRK
ncbi:MAG: serine/threonine-protein kinase [Acidobacteriota bacterium]